MKHITITLTETQANGMIDSLKYILKTTSELERGSKNMKVFCTAQASARLLHLLEPKIEKAKEQL